MTKVFREGPREQITLEQMEIMRWRSIRDDEVNTTVKEDYFAAIRKDEEKNRSN